MAETGGSSYRRPVRAMLFCYFAENRTGVCLPAIRGLVGTLAFSTLFLRLYRSAARYLNGLRPQGGAAPAGCPDF